MPSGGGGGGVPVPTTAPTMPPTTVPTMIPTTTTTAPQCQMMDNLVLFYEQEDIELAPETYGAEDPVSTCSTCTGPGRAGYFTPANTAVPSAGTQAAGSMAATTCRNMCICAVSGECFRTNNVNTGVTFWPYCSGGTCGMYVYIREGNFMSTTTSTVYTGDAQINDDFSIKPVTDSSYFSAKSIGCTSCTPMSCNG